MLFVIVTVRFFDYEQEHEHESGNPERQASTQEPEEPDS